MAIQIIHQSYQIRNGRFTAENAIFVFTDIDDKSARPFVSTVNVGESEAGLILGQRLNQQTEIFLEICQFDTALFLLLLSTSFTLRKY